MTRVMNEQNPCSISLLFPAVEDPLVAIARLDRAVAACAEGDHMALIVDGLGGVSPRTLTAADLLAEAPLLPVRADALTDGIRLEAVRSTALFPVRPVGLDRLNDILALARRVYFLPKKTWKTGHVEMIEDGLRKGVWRAIGLFDGDRLVGYLDCRDLSDGGLEVGFSMTDPDYRRRGLQKRLIAHMALTHFNRKCDISSSEGNPTLKVLEGAGFQITRKKPGERLDGSTSIYLSRPAWQPMHFSWPSLAPTRHAEMMADLG